MNLFENPQIDIFELPKVEELDFSSLEPTYLKVKYYGTILLFIFFLIGIIILFVASPIEEVPYLPYIIPGIWLLLFTVALLFVRPRFKKKSYALRQKDIVYKSGLIWQSTTVIPFNRVQHCDIKQGPIERIFNLSKLNVYTAGGATSDLSVPGLKPERAQKIKDYIIKKTVLDEEEE